MEEQRIEVELSADFAALDCTVNIVAVAKGVGAGRMVVAISGT